MRILAAVITALAVAASVAGCTPGVDRSVPPSSHELAPCPAGDRGRIADKWLAPPDWWVCLRV